MASISEITQAASYRGDPALGGELGVAVTLDTTPIQRLATFNYYRDRDMWQRKQVEDKMAADQIAEISAYDITSPLKPYADDLKNELNDIQTFIRANPDALVYSRNPGKFQELNEKINRFKTKRKAATANDVLYNAAKSNAEKIPDSNERDIQIRSLDLKAKKLFSQGLETAYNTQLESTPPLQPSDFVIPDIAPTTRSFIQEGANKDFTTEITYFDLDDAKSKAAIAVASKKDDLDVNSDAFKRLSPDEQQLEIDKAALTNATRKSIANISASFNAGLAELKATMPDVDLTTVDINSLPDGIIEDNVRSIRLVNDQIDELNSYVTQGKIKDPSGRVRTKPYGKINLNDGLSEDEIVLMKMIQKNGNSLLSKVDKKLTQTDNALQSAQLSETIRHNKAAENLNAGQLKLEQDKWKTSMTGSETVKNGAMERAKRIYNDMKKLADKNGFISPDKVRQLNSEQLKYLGVEQVETSEQGVPRSIYKPLSFDEDVEYGIQLVNGEIKVMKAGELRDGEVKTGNKLGRLENGTYTGLWDNGKSTNLFNVATNILNEQLKNAGAKELNAYLPIDLGTGGVSENTVGGGSMQSGVNSTRSSSSQPQIPTYSRSELKGANWTDAQIEAAVKAGKINVQ